MQMTFRWFGADDPIPLRAHPTDSRRARRRQRALRRGRRRRWPKSATRGARRARSTPPASRSPSSRASPCTRTSSSVARRAIGLIDQYCESVQQHGRRSACRCSATTSCRSSTGRAPISPTLQPDGSTALAYDDAALCAHRPLARHGRPARLGDGVRRRRRCERCSPRIAHVDEERLWENLAYFLERVVPVAESAGVRMAIHPDDPPWSIFGLPRIITSGAALERLTRLVDSPANGVTFCTGSLGADPDERSAGDRARISGRAAAFISRTAATSKCTGPRQFHEAPHPSRVRRRRHARRARRRCTTRVSRTDASRSRTHDLGRDRPARLRALRSRARRDVSPGTLGRHSPDVNA